VRNVGLLTFPAVADVQLALALQLDPAAARFIAAPEQMPLLGLTLPLVRLWPDSPVLTLRAEAALSRYGLG
jgi:hypothetical protein